MSFSASSAASAADVTCPTTRNRQLLRCRGPVDGWRDGWPSPRLPASLGSLCPSAASRYITCCERRESLLTLTVEAVTPRKSTNCSKRPALPLS